MTDATATRVLPGRLTQRTMRSLRAFFDQQGHRPSPDMWTAMQDLASTMEAMAKGAAAPRFYLSALDPGVGKTQTMTRFIDALLADQSYSHVGAIICVGRLSEVDKIAREGGIPRESLCVVTSDEKINALGRASADRAPVLITTQQMIAVRTDGKPFGECREFFFRGKPRQVRVWDEAFLPGETITLSRDDLAFLLRETRFAYPKLTDDLEDLFIRLRNEPDGAVVALPDYTRLRDVELNDLLALLLDTSDAYSEGSRPLIPTQSGQ